MTESFDERLYREIPLAKQIGVRAREISPNSVSLEAPLAPNMNPKMTAFGGSIYSVAVLSCWALVNEAARVAGLKSGYIVVQDASIDYLLPVETDFYAEARWLTDRDHERFLETLRRKGLARATLHSAVFCGGNVCARLEARFAAQIENA